MRALPPQPLEGSSATNQVVLTGVSCPSRSLCVAVGALDTVAFSRSPTADADRWHVVSPTYDEPKPLRYWVSIGHHVLRVRAIGRTGLRGPVTALRFAVMHPHRD